MSLKYLDEDSAKDNQYPIKWLDYSENNQAITKLRKQVFDEEQKLGDFFVGEDDPDGIH